MPTQFQGFSGVPQLIAKVTANPGSVTAATVGTVNLTVAGSQPDMHYIVTAPDLEANLGIGGAYCTTAGTVVVRLVNPTVGNIDPASQTFYVIGL